MTDSIDKRVMDHVSRIVNIGKIHDAEKITVTMDVPVFPTLSQSKSLVHLAVTVTYFPKGASDTG